MITLRFPEIEGKKADGSAVKIPPAVVLVQRGPVIPVVILPNPAFSKALQDAGRPIPAPIQGIALIDTGATTTCVDGDVATEMGLAANGVAKMASASQTSSECLTYPVRLTFPIWNVHLDCAKAMGVHIKNQGIVVLVGRDLLSKCVMVYNGADGTVTLAM
jgi:predicted aspartyl protease